MYFWIISGKEFLNCGKSSKVQDYYGLFEPFIRISFQIICLFVDITIEFSGYIMRYNKL